MILIALDQMTNKEIVKALNGMEKQAEIISSLVEENEAEGKASMVTFLKKFQTTLENRMFEFEEQYDDNLHTV